MNDNDNEKDKENEIKGYSDIDNDSFITMLIIKINMG